ncbi:MAG: LacI family DNA-binding transcriptional regulator, partial [Nonomuraea sp.]|nr:LacI family DNA-binding transcriptional regulator [Nonomuraea sp.]
MTDLPTLAQVAAEAGVSPATASRVLTGTVRVSTSTRRQVHDAMSRLGYVRHRAPRGAPARRSASGVAAVVCGHLHRVFAEPYYQRLLAACEETLAELGVPLVVAAVVPGGPVPAPVLAGAADGVLLVGAAESLAITLSTSGRAVRAIGRPADGVKLP